MQARLAQYDTAIAGLNRAVVLFALQEVGAFPALLEGPLTADALAQKTKTDLKNLVIFLDVAAAVGFLSREGDLYGLIPGDESIFDASEDIVNPLAAPPLIYWLPRRAMFADVLRSGKAIPSAGGGGAVSEATRREFLLRHDAHSRPVAGEVAALLCDRALERIVDIGCGLGTYSFAVLLLCPEATAVLVDRPNAAAVVLERAAELGLSDRVTFCGEDLFDGPVLSAEENADLVFLSNILHDYPAEAAERAVARAASCLRPGGWLAVKDYDIDEDCRGPLSALDFRVSMAVFTGGTLWSEGTVRSWLPGAGLRWKRTHALREEHTSYLVLAEKV
ncbi:MAG: SAM-dependent methyltransferase [Myxococcota bacterium]|jgi:SAM-dependent methyltransferase